MTRKDYETVAACLERALNAPDSPRHEAQVRDIAQRLALEFELDNPRFDGERFFVACGFVCTKRNGKIGWFAANA